MINVTEYNATNVTAGARAAHGSRWITVDMNGHSFTMFFDSQEEFDIAIRAFQNMTAPEPEHPIEVPARHESERNLDDEVPF